MEFPAGRWGVESLAIGGELQPTLPGSLLTLEVSPQGEVSGSTGINELRGRLGEDRVFGRLATTSQRSGPHEILAQERIFIRHLEAAEDVEVDPGSGGINLVARGLIVVALEGLPVDSTG